MVGDPVIPSAVRSISASALATLLRYNYDDNVIWIDNAKKRGIFQAIIATSVDLVFLEDRAPHDGQGVVNFLNSNTSFEPVLSMLESIAQSKSGTMAFVDHLNVNRKCSLLMPSSPIRLIADQHPELHEKRLDMVIPLLRFILQISMNDVRFGLRFIKAHLEVVLDGLRDIRTIRDAEVACLFTSLLTVCAGEGFGYEFQEIAGSEASINQTVLKCLEEAIVRVKSFSNTASIMVNMKKEPEGGGNLIRHNFQLIRTCLFYLNRRMVKSDGNGSEEEIPLIMDVVQLFVVRCGSSGIVDLYEDDRRDLEQSLCRLLFLLKKEFNSKRDLPGLKMLFPKTLGASTQSSYLEGIVQSNGKRANHDDDPTSMIVKLSKLILDIRFQSPSSSSS